MCRFVVVGSLHGFCFVWHGADATFRTVVVNLCVYLLYLELHLNACFNHSRVHPHTKRVTLCEDCKIKLLDLQHVYEVPVSFPSSVSGIFVCALYMTFQEFAPTARRACKFPDRIPPSVFYSLFMYLER